MADLVHLEQAEAVFPSGDGLGPLTLTLAPGEQVLVVGPSGAGKSTLLGLLHGAVPQHLHAQVTGHLTTAGRDPRTTPLHELASTVGLVMQDPEAGVCLPGVLDDVALVLENLGTPPGQIEALARAALAVAGASALADRPTGTLSGGELQRVALAAGTVAHPLLLLLDEPTSMLDPAGVDAVRHAIRSVQAATGAAVVLVEHRLDEVAGDEGLAGLPPRWLVLDAGGRLTHDGPVTAMTLGQVRSLHDAGCWLPLDLELRALLGGHPDDLTVGEALAPALDDGAVRAALRALRAPGEGEGAGATVTSAAPSQPEEVLVSARGLAVARGTIARERRRRTAQPVLAGLDLDLRAGELTAVVGANGTGKTTLLTTLAGLEPALDGTVHSPRAAMVFQNPEHQLSEPTVRAELARGLPPGERTDARVQAELERWGLANHATTSPFRLSGGQKRMLSLACVLLHDRPVLYADEPAYGLDRRRATEVMRLLRAHADAGRAVVLASHDLRAVAAWCDRVLVLGPRPDGAGSPAAPADPGASARLPSADLPRSTVLADGPADTVLRGPGAAALLTAAGLRPSRLVTEVPGHVLRRLALQGASTSGGAA